MKAIVAGIAAVLAACSVDSGSLPRSSSVAITVHSATPMSSAAPLRYAVVFIYPGDFVVTADGPIAADETITVPLTTPFDRWEQMVTPLETAILPSNTSLDVYRPRIVVYEDIDQSDDFAPNVVAGGVDRIVAIDSGSSSTSVAAVPDLDTVLSKMTFEETEAYYAASGDRYTPFIRVQAASGYLELTNAARAGPVRLDLAESPIPGEHFVCGRSAVYLYGDPLAPATHVSVLLDSGIDPGEVCGATIPACATIAFADLPAPDFSESPDQAHRRVVQCRANERFQVVVIQEADMNCNTCVCNYSDTAAAYFANPLALPTWWPCNVSVGICESSLPLYELDAACVP